MDAERTGKRGPHQADTPPRVGNYVTARVGNYVTDNPSHLGNYVTADNLDAKTYMRVPGPASVSGPFAFDSKPMVITRVVRWPRVGSTSLVVYDDPAYPDDLEQWRQSSQIVSITKIPARTSTTGGRTGAHSS